MGKEVGAIGFYPLYMGRLEQFFGQERQYDADVMLTYGPDADLVKLAAFAERLRQEGRSVRCEQETGAKLSDALPEKGAVHRRDLALEGGAGMINVALPKGRLGETAYETLAAAGYDCPSILEKNRKLTFENLEKGVRYFWVKPSDVSIYVWAGGGRRGHCRTGHFAGVPARRV